MTDLDAASLRAVEGQRRKSVSWLRANVKAYGDASDLVGSGFSVVWSGIATRIAARAHENSSGSRERT